MATSEFGDILNSAFSSGTGFGSQFIQAFLWTIIGVFLVGLLIGYLYIVLSYPNKKLIVDIYNGKIKKDRVGIRRQKDGTEFLKFLWLRYITFPPKVPTKVFIKYGASKFDIFPAYGNPTNVYKEVNSLVGLFGIKKKKADEKLNDPEWFINRDTKQMIHDSRLKQVDYDAMDVFAALLPSQTRKYQTPGIWEKYGSTISMLMVLTIAFIFFFFLADQFAGVAEILRDTTRQVVERTPPLP